MSVPPRSVDPYGALLKLRGDEANRLGLMPYQVLSDNNIRDILKHKPSNLEKLATVPSVSSETLRSIGNAIVKLFQLPAQEAASSSSSPSDSMSNAPRKTNIPVILPRRRGAGGKLAVDDGETIATHPQPIIVDVVDLLPLDSDDAILYEKYQKEMKSIESLKEGDTIENIQKRLLHVFCVGYPLQLSRLGINSAKSVYNSIPTILALRQGAPGETLKLEIEDLSSGRLAQSIRSLYPDVSDVQATLALCEWYHDLNPELHLNSAKYVAPRTRKKRKAHSAIEEEDEEDLEVSSATKTQSRPLNALLRSNAENVVKKKNGFPVNPVRKSPRNAGHVNNRARKLLSGNHHQQQQDQLDEDNEPEVDQDPSADYTEKKSSNGSTVAWKAVSTRPRKIPKRAGMESVGQIPFTGNMNKERLSLTDDDFAGTEEAYFADVYSPAKPISHTSSKPSPNVATNQLQASKSDQLSSRSSSSKPPTSVLDLNDSTSGEMETHQPAEQQPPASSNNTITTSNEKEAQEAASLIVEKVYPNYDGLSAKEILDRFNRLRAACAVGAVN
jgi:hypothetical protein